MNLVSVRPDPTLTTVNLKAPVIVNLKNMTARQIVLDDSRFPTRMLLWQPGEESEGEKK
jgi:flagellar assembly factor FliW